MGHASLSIRYALHEALVVRSETHNQSTVQCYRFTWKTPEVAWHYIELQRNII